MENAGSEAPWVPSLTLMTMLDVVPRSLLEGMPPSSPVEMLKLAQDGLF